MDYQELKQRIKIEDVAVYIGYVYNPRAGRSGTVEYRLYSGNQKIDEIVIYRVQQQSYFSRSGIGDKGDLINFVFNRLSFFPGRKSSKSWEAVSEILHSFIGHTCDRKEDIPHINNKSFNISDYCLDLKKNILYAFLNKTRGISIHTINRFLSIGSLYTVSKIGNHYVNIAFPYRKIGGNGDIVNFELRNYRPDVGSYKGFCPGGNKSDACWIASFASTYAEVTDLYIGESGIDMMSLMELLGTDLPDKSAFISIGGNLTGNQLKDLNKVFVNARIHLAFDNDVQGRIYSLQAAILLKEGHYKKIFNNNNGKIVMGDQFLPLNFDVVKYINNIKGQLDIDIIIPTDGAKDFNELLNLKNK